MRIICPKCDAAYDVAPEAIGADGRIVRCASCSSEWFQAPELAAPAVKKIGAATAAAGAAGAAAQAAGPRQDPNAQPGAAFEEIYFDDEPAARRLGAADVVDEESFTRRAMPTYTPPEEDDEGLSPRSGGAFLAGFATVTFLALVLIAAYVKAPELAELVPAAKAPLTAFTDVVDQGRLALMKATGEN